MKGVKNSIDQEKIQALIDLSQETGENLLESLINMFVYKFDLKMEFISKNLEIRNMEEIAKTAHTMKSSCAYLGINSYSELFQLMQENVHKDPEHTEAIIQQIKQSYPEIKKELLQIKAKNSGIEKFK